MSILKNWKVTMKDVRNQAQYIPLVTKMEKVIIEDLMNVKIKKQKISCCKSYLTKKGRCYDCLEDETF